jgi:hypothetical protein
MNLKEIKASVESGQTVHWASQSYRVIKDGVGQWLIQCDINGHCIGLTWRDGETLNGKERQFFVGTSSQLERR